MTGVVANNQTPKSETRNPFRVLVVDDSAVIRGFLARWLEEDRDISVVATAANGQMAVNSVKSSNAEVVVLDIEMPVMDGMTALPKLLEEVPDIKVLMSSTLTVRNADISIQAMRKGAADYVAKPQTNRDLSSTDAFKAELIQKVKALATSVRRGRGEALPEFEKSGGAIPVGEVEPPKKRSTDIFSPAARAAPLVFQKPSRERPSILAIGSSTGGPQAVCRFLADAKDAIKGLPVIITQHMPATFTTIFADHVAKATGMDAKEGFDGAPLKPGCIYVAPGDFHMEVNVVNGEKQIKLNQNPPENYCRPAVDPMFRSVAKAYGGKVLAVVLTGMGHDGMEGSKDLVAAGATVLAQDEETSVVWGMPGSVVLAGLSCAAIPIGEMGAAASRLIAGSAL